MVVACEFCKNEAKVSAWWRAHREIPNGDHLVLKQEESGLHRVVRIVKMEKPWETNWEKGKVLGGGGQGVTFHAHNKKSGEDGFVLKTLKRPQDPECRKRMSREVAALRTLMHHGIAEHVDSNGHEFENTGVELYTA